MGGGKKYDIRAILNKVRWTSGDDLRGIEVEFVSRGEHQDTGRIVGAEIVGIGPDGIETASRTIPYHRITRIVSNGEIVFQRP